MNMQHPPADELLERLWYAREEQRPFESDDDAAAAELIAAKLAERRGTTLELTEEGAERARGIVRRHRLAEILFTQVLEVDPHDAEKSACELEHVLAERVVDRVCTFLGHPPACPHGHPIPQGSCCQVYAKKVDPLITRLIDLPLGSSGSVVFIAPKSVSRLNKLAAFGLVPGSQIRLIERKPSVVLACGQTSLAVEDEIGREIYVRPAV
jgi:DtxR family transcriptional regulator, Mn-dependent transcriptional regulator